GAAEESIGLEQRQADDVRIGTVERAHERRGSTLDGVAAGLAAPLVRGEIGRHLLFAQALERNERLYQPRPEASIRGDQRDAAEHAVSAAGEQRKAAPRRRRILRLRQDAA